jgi:hypothetical protein
MPANAKQVMRILDYRGISVRLVNGKLVGRANSGVLPDDMARFIRHFKDLIVAELNERQRLEETAANIVALTPEELVLYLQELAAPPPNDPNLAHDRRAYNMVMAWMAERSEAA